jgi:hypothetical protein
VHPGSSPCLAPLRGSTTRRFNRATHKTVSQAYLKRCMEAVLWATWYVVVKGVVNIVAPDWRGL